MSGPSKPAVLVRYLFKVLKELAFRMPGPFDYVKGISYIRGVAKYENLYGFNIADAVSDELIFCGLHQVYK